jgi:NAD(P)-dependent dehydrogenase (short-subunit alcohol dehydrogenase family)
VQTTLLPESWATLGCERVSADIGRVGRAGTPSDIAPVILFLCSDASRWINGANLAADGGLEAALNTEVFDL